MYIDILYGNSTVQFMFPALNFIELQIKINFTKIP